MTKSSVGRSARVRGMARVLLVASACALMFPAYAGASAGALSVRTLAQGGRVEVRMRSFTPNAQGRVTVEPSLGGGEGRLTVLNLPDPQTLAPGSRAYVVWATGGGRVVRIGELKVDRRGNGGLAFERPAGFDRYGIVVTAEASADVERPGSPVLSTRAGEIAPLFPSADDARDSAHAPPLVPDLTESRRPRRAGANFYDEVDDALRAENGGRIITLDGTQLAPRARGIARATTHAGRAYVRARFDGVPIPSAVGASVYVTWAIVPDGRIVYMGSLPVTEDLNRAEIYVRVADFGTDSFNLFVTAERQRPVPAPSDRRILTPRGATMVVK